MKETKEIEFENIKDSNLKVKTEFEHVVEAEIVSLFLKDIINSSEEKMDKGYVKKNRNGATKKQ